MDTRSLIITDKVLIVVPAYNEAENLKRTLDELKSCVPFDILVVDDGSKDNTSQVSRQKGVQVIRLPFNLGIGGAVQTGYKYALYNGYEIVVQVDADGQHDASDLSKLVDLLTVGTADIAIGSRYLDETPLKVSWIRDFGIRYFSWLTGRVIGQKITDCTSGFRAINRRALVFFSENYPVDFPDAEALILAHKAGLRVSELPAKFRRRSNGKSSLRMFRFLYYPFKETFSVLMILTKRSVKD